MVPLHEVSTLRRPAYALRKVELWPAEAEAYRPPDEITVSQWADRYRVLDRMTSAEPGPWRTERTPYLREVLDSFTADGVEQITLKTSTQVGKTECLLNTLGYAMHQDPGPGIFIMPRDPDAIRINTLRIKPMFEASPALREQLTARASDWKNETVQFRRSVLFMASANSPASLAGNPCRYAWFDEADKAPVWAGREADPLDLARERLRTFVGIRMLVVSSTPTIAEGRIHKEYERSDQREYYIPCPHCGYWQTLQWERVQLNGCDDSKGMLAKNLATYPCEGCDENIADGDKLEALERGRWVSAFGSIDRKTGEVTEPETPNPNRGYFLWAAYSPWITWAELAAKHLEAEESNDPAKKMNFTNSWLAELWEETVEETTKGAIRAAVCKYEEASPPDWVKVLTAGVDVQKRELYLSVWGWGYDERVCLVIERRLRTFDALDEYAASARYGGLRVRMIGIDSRYRSDQVFDFARDHRRNVLPFRGVETDTPLPFPSTSKVERNPKTGVPYRRALVVWHVNVGVFKDRLAASIQVGPDTERPHSFHVHSDPSDEFCGQMSAERKVLDRTGQKVRARWVLRPGRKANHYWDTAVYAWAAAEAIHVPTLRTKSSSPRAGPPRRRKRRMLGGNLGRT